MLPTPIEDTKEFWEKELLDNQRWLEELKTNGTIDGEKPPFRETVKDLIESCNANIENAKLELQKF